MENQLIFDESKHIYTLNGVDLVSVTQSLQMGGLIDTTWFTDEARDRGTAVHKAIQLDLENDLHVDSLHPIIKGYVQGWFNFKRDTRIKAIMELCEVRQYHPIYLYAGTPDFVGILNGRHVLIDYKTGDTKTACYQTAAYAHFPKIMAYQPERYGLRLYNDGKYRLIKYDNPNDFDFFINNLNKVRLLK